MKIRNYWHWLFLALLIPYAIYIWCNAPSHRQNYTECSEYSSSLSRYEVITAPTSDTAEQHQTKYDEKVKLQAELECSDLHAQWAMADVTFWAFGAGLAGIALIILTWLSTREAVSVSREAARDELRAYVEVKRAYFGPDIIVEAVNTGATPAKWFEVGAVSQVVEITKGMDWDSLIDFGEVERFQRWPALATDLTARLMAKNEAINTNEARFSRKALLVYGTVRYETIFKEIFETQFAFVATDKFKHEDKLTRVTASIKAFELATINK